VRLDHAEAVRVDEVLDVAVLSGNEGDSQGPVPGLPRLRGMAVNPMPQPCTYSFRAAANFMASAALNLDCPVAQVASRITWRCDTTRDTQGRSGRLLQSGNRQRPDPESRAGC
jgi:hypothetical protein